MKKQDNKDKTIFIATYIMMFSVLIIYLLACYLTAYYISKESTQTIIILSSTLVLIIAAFCAIAIESKVSCFICKKCNHKFQPSAKKMTVAPHIWTTRYLKCPECGKRSWCKKTIQK